FISFMTLFFLFTNGLIFYVRSLVRKRQDLKWVNIPHKDYWLKPENQAEARFRLSALLSGTLIFVNVLCLVVIALSASGLSGSIVNWVMGFIVGMCLLLGLGVYRGFRR